MRHAGGVGAFGQGGRRIRSSKDQARRAHQNAAKKSGAAGEAIGGDGNASTTACTQTAGMLHATKKDVSRDPGPQAVALSKSDRTKVARINAEVRRAGAELRQRWPWLRHQNALGVFALSVSVLGMVGSGWLYVAGALPAWACIVVSALFASIAHEVEHDLIHSLYFPRQSGIRALMLVVAWLTRPIIVNPFLRRKLHLHHHKASGHEDDIEERAITNGEPYGVKRILMMADGVLAVLLRLDQAKKSRTKLVVFAAVGYFPLGWIHYALFYTFLLSHGLALAGAELPLSASAAALVDAACVVWILPNVLRSFCLNFVSSSMHFYGDVQRGNVLQQTQVLNAWFLAPLQLFCFNFGSTHAIHHFVASEPFYIRQLTARAGHRVLRANGVRFNDLGTFLRGNRYEAQESAETLASQANWAIREAK
jgi:fatty acid desaturase